MPVSLYSVGEGSSCFSDRVCSGVSLADHPFEPPWNLHGGEVNDFHKWCYKRNEQ